MPRLTVIDGEDSGVSIEIGDTPITIGHQESRDLVLKDDRVSRRHATIERRAGETIIRDDNSSNGTLLNGQLITEAKVRPGDLLLIGGNILLYEEEHEPVDRRDLAERVAADRAQAGRGRADSTADTLPVHPPTEQAQGATKADEKKTVLLTRQPKASPPQPVSSAGNDIVSLLREVAEAAKPAADQNGVTIRVNAEQQSRTCTDPALTYRLLAQLVAACLEGSKRGGPALTALTLSLETEETKAVRVVASGDQPRGARQSLEEALRKRPLSDIRSPQPGAKPAVEAVSPDDSGEEIFALILP